MNKKLNSFFKHWPIYLTGVIITSFLVCAGISIKCKPTEKEKIMVFAASGTIDVGTFVKESLSVCEESIREIEVKHGYCNEDTTSIVFGMTYAYCDFYIFPESWVERIKPLALTFTKDQINSEIPNSTNLPLLQDGDSNIGIQIYNKQNKEGRLKSLISFEQERNEENYYILLRKTSYHIGDFNNSPSKNALSVINKLLTL